MMKKLSIIIPCYNVENYIMQCLESVIKQTYHDLEIICINDGSTDKTLEFLKSFKEKNSSLSIITQSNAGISAARNTGILKAKGTFIMFLDADDWIENTAVQTLMEKSDADLICCSYNRIFKNIKAVRKLHLNGNYDAAFIQRRMVGLLDEELKDPSQADSLVTAWGKLYRRAIILKNEVKFTDTKLIGTEDALFNIQYLEFANRVEVVDQPLYNYQKANNVSLTKTYKPHLFTQWKLLYSNIEETIKGKNEDFHKALKNRICLSIIGLGLNESISPNSTLLKIRRLKIILEDPLYKDAFAVLELNYFPLHWKIFFLLAKRKKPLLLLMMLNMINKLINRKN